MEDFLVTYQAFILQSFRKFHFLKKSQFLCSLHQFSRIDSKNVKVLETLINPTKNLRTRKWDLTARYLSKKALKLTDAEKSQTFENFVRGRSRQDLFENCLGHLGQSLNHPRSWISLTILFDPRWLQQNRVKKKSTEYLSKTLPLNNLGGSYCLERYSVDFFWMILWIPRNLDKIVKFT
jgi:hypothetical protein